MQVCLEYSSYVGTTGLTRDGLQAMYNSGHGDLDADYIALGLDVTFPEEQARPWLHDLPSKPQVQQAAAYTCIPLFSQGFRTLDTEKHIDTLPAGELQAIKDATAKSQAAATGTLRQSNLDRAPADSAAADVLWTNASYQVPHSAAATPRLLGTLAGEPKGQSGTQPSAQNGGQGAISPADDNAPAEPPLQEIEQNEDPPVRRSWAGGAFAKIGAMLKPDAGKQRRPADTAAAADVASSERQSEKTAAGGQQEGVTGVVNDAHATVTAGSLTGEVAGKDVEASQKAAGGKASAKSAPAAKGELFSSCKTAYSPS